MTVKNIVNIMRELVAELLYIMIMPILIFQLDHLRIIYLDSMLTLIMLISTMFSFAFPRVSSFVNLLLAFLLVNEILYRQKKFFR